MDQRTKNRIDFLVNLLYYAAVILLVYLGIKYVLGWVLPFIVAFCIVSIVNPVIRFVNNKLKLSHRAASITVMVLIYVLTAYLLFMLVWLLFGIMSDVFTILPSYYESKIAPAISRIGANIETFIQNLSPDWVERITGIQGDLLNTIQSLLVTISQAGMSYVTRFTGQIPSFLIAFVFTIMLSFFISSNYSTVTAFIKAQLPNKAKRLIGELRSVINDIILRYIKAIVKLMFITFVELSIGLLVLRVSNAIIVAAGIAVFDALPLFGTGAIMIPWAIIELIQGNFALALGLGILYAIVTVIRNIIEPHVVGQKLGMNPIVSIVSIYLGYKLIGIFGMIIMPMITQIVMELQNKGAIKLFNTVKTADGPETEAPEPPRSDGPPKEE